MRITIGPIPEVEGKSSMSSDETGAHPAQRKPNDNYPMNETSLSSIHYVNTTLYIPLQLTQRPSVSIPFGTISNPKQKQPIVPETIITYALEPFNLKPSEIIVSGPPQIPKILISQILNQPNDAPSDHSTVTTTEQPPELT